MLRLRAVRTVSRSLRRGNATIASSVTGDSAAVPPPPPGKDTPPHVDAVPVTPRKPVSKPKATSTSEASKDISTESASRSKKQYPTHRPSITLERPREWNRPVQAGVLPAYDEALKLIRADSEALKNEVEDVRKKLASAQGEEAEALQKKVEILEVQSEINLPDVRWKFRNGLADLSKPVYRHLANQKWREEGDLDLLMERVHQMNVVPDILPELHPTIDLRVNFPEAPPQSAYLRARTKRKYAPVEPGVFLLPEQTRKQPNLYATVLHPDTRLYTLLMVDPDVPNEEAQSFSTYLHWMQPNISLSTSTTKIEIENPLARYIPPHPQRGTPYHRYVLLLLPHADPTAPIKVPSLTPEQRANFDVRAFATHYGLDGAKGGGVHMWRAVWDEEVSKIYKEVLKTEEPQFGRPRKADPYAAIKGKSKYATAA